MNEKLTSVGKGSTATGVEHGPVFYSAPLPAPGESDYRTLDNVRVRLDPGIDPRQQLTQVSMRAMTDKMPTPLGGVLAVAATALVLGGGLSWLLLEKYWAPKDASGTPVAAAADLQGASSDPSGHNGPSRKGQVTELAPRPERSGGVLGHATDGPALSDPALSDPAPSDPAPSDPAPSDPALIGPAQGGPAVSVKSVPPAAPSPGNSALTARVQADSNSEGALPAVRARRRGPSAGGQSTGAPTVGSDPPKGVAESAPSVQPAFSGQAERTWVAPTRRKAWVD